MYQHPGVTTNNNAEAFNFKMGAKKKISKHPNPYVLAEEILTQLKEASDTMVAETVTSHNKKVDPRLKELRKRKKGLMKDLGKRNIDLETYLASMGANTIKYQPMILVDSDPLADIASDTEEFDQDDPEGIENEDPEVPVLPDLPPLTGVHPAPLVAQQVRTQQNRKGKRTKQKAVPNSEESFEHVESLADLDGPCQASVGGSELRELRRQVPDESEESGVSGSSLLTSAVLASASIGVLSRFMARSSASASPRRQAGSYRTLSASPRRPSVHRSTPPRRPSVHPSESPRRPSAAPRSISNTSSLVMPDIHSSAKVRVQSLGFRFSSSQPFTKGDGNCMLYAIWDQLHKCNHSILSSLQTPHDLRLHVCSKLSQQLECDLIFWVEAFSPESWLSEMRKDKTWCDDVFLQLVANIFNKNIILIPLSSSSAHHAGMYLDIRSAHGGQGDPFFMLYFEEWRMAGHYQSLEPDPSVTNNRVIAHFTWRLKSLANSFQSEPTGSNCPPPLPTANTGQLQSTRQRIDSDGALSLSAVASPITSREDQSLPTSTLTTSSSQPTSSTPPGSRRPKPVKCKKRAELCTHVIAFGEHYNKKAWAAYKNYLESQHAITDVPNE